MWQYLHALSSVRTPPGAGWFSPVAKLMLLWHAPQALRFGLFFQLSPCGVALTPLTPFGSPVWQFAQLVIGCGNPTSSM